MLFTLIGEEREGGYIFVSSSDLRGFTLMLEPGERDIEKTIEAIRPALMGHLDIYLRAKLPSDDKEILLVVELRFLFVDLLSRPMRLVVEAKKRRKFSC